MFASLFLIYVIPSIKSGNCCILAISNLNKLSSQYFFRVSTFLLFSFISSIVASFLSVKIRIIMAFNKSLAFSFQNGSKLSSFKLFFENLFNKLYNVKFIPFFAYSSFISLNNDSCSTLKSIDFKVEQESLLRLINDEYAKNGINLTLYNLLNKFSKNNLKDDSLDPFWKENARLLLNAIIILILTDKKEATIEDIKEKSKNVETLKKYCEDNLFKLDIASIQQFPDLMDGITYIRKSEANKTINSSLEIINESI